MWRRASSLSAARWWFRVLFVREGSRIGWGLNGCPVALVPADGRAPTLHHHGGQLLRHDIGVVVTRTSSAFLGRCQVPQHRRTQAVQIDPGRHMSSSGEWTSSDQRGCPPVAGAPSRAAAALAHHNDEALETDERPLVSERDSGGAMRGMGKMVAACRLRTDGPHWAEKERAAHVYPYAGVVDSPRTIA